MKSNFSSSDGNITAVSSYSEYNNYNEISCYDCSHVIDYFNYIWLVCLLEHTH
jgi:hypothetical protein